LLLTLIAVGVLIEVGRQRRLADTLPSGRRS
jgi:hypothetical protein